MARTDDLFTQALELSPVERAKLARRLLLSLEGEEVSGTEAIDAWAIEIERRLAEVDSGTAELVSWSAVRRRLSSKLKKRR